MKAPVYKLHHCTYSLSYHFVFVTKDRRCCLTAPMLERLKEIIHELVANYGRVLEMNGECDHIHMVLELNPKASPAGMANMLKTTSSRLLRRDFKETLDKAYGKPVLWNRSYFVASCGGAQPHVIKQYIEQQERSE
jgi:putative transposase